MKTEVIGGDGYQRKVVVLGGNGFIGHHLARRLKSEGAYVLVVDIEECQYGNDHATDILIGDLRDHNVVYTALHSVHEVYQMAADMGGCQFVFTGENDSDIMHNSALINLNVLDVLREQNFKGKIFYSSSACIYPEQSQMVPNGHALKEYDAYPAGPDSNYGWEKLFSERLYEAYHQNHDIDIRVARFHNIYGPEGVYEGGREKAPASISRKVAEATDVVKMWGDGTQTRSFLYIDDCLDAIQLLMKSPYTKPINIGSDESVSIKQLWEMAIDISGKQIQLQSIPRPGNFLGVHGRNSDNTLFKEVTGINPRKHSLREGMEKTYHWIANQIQK